MKANKYIYLYIVVMVALYACPAAASTAEECMRYRNAGKYKDAVKAGEAAVEVNKGDMAAWYCLGDSWGYLNEPAPAVSALANAATVARKDYDKMKIYYRLGEIMATAGNQEIAALEAWTQCLTHARKVEDDKTIVIAMNQQAHYLTETGQADKAIPVYTALAVMLKGDKRRSVVLNNLAALYVKKKQYAKAIEALTEAVAEDEKTGEGGLNLFYHKSALGYAYLQSGQPGVALKILSPTYNDAVRSKVQDKLFMLTINRYLAELYLSTGYYKKGRYHADEAKRYAPPQAVKTVAKSSKPPQQRKSVKKGKARVKK